MSIAVWEAPLANGVQRIVQNVRHLFNSVGASTDRLTASDMLKLVTIVYKNCNADQYEFVSSANRTDRKIYYWIEKELQKYVDLHYSELAKFDNVERLRQYVRQTECVVLYTKIIDHVFHHLNKKLSGELSVKDLGIKLWATSNQLGTFIDCINDLVNRARTCGGDGGGGNGGNGGDTLVYRFVECVINISGPIKLDDVSSDDATDTPDTPDTPYQSLISQFVAATSEYYTLEGVNKFSTKSLTEYIRYVLKRIDQEQSRCKKYFRFPESINKIVKCMEKVLIAGYTDSIQSGFIELLKNDQLDDVQNMYLVLSRVSGSVECLVTLFEPYVLNMALKAVESVAQAAMTDPKLYIETCLSVILKYKHIIATAFKNDEKFTNCFDRTCRKFVNNNMVCKLSTKTAESLVTYIDSLLKNTKSGSDIDIETTITNAMLVFKYIDDKDAFQTYYSKSLAKRLIRGTYEDDFESSMISKIKGLCGNQYTINLQRMFTDIDVSRTLNEEFTTINKENTFDFGVTVLTQGAWPLSASQTSIVLPMSIQNVINSFQTFYGAKFNGRKLRWFYNMSKAEVKTTYLTSAKAGYTLLCSVYQLAILMLFNDSDTWSFNDLLAITQLPINTLSNTLETLTTTRILLPIGLPVDKDKDKTNGQNSVFKLNPGFKYKMLKVNINIQVAKEQKEEIAAMQQTIEVDRKHAISAAIVRIAKMRKEITHQVLMAETISQLATRFTPTIPMIKKSIEHLIETEYLDRKSDNSYVYLA